MAKKSNSRLSAIGRASSGARPMLLLPEYLSIKTDGNLSVNTRQLPIPDNTYDADVLWVQRRMGAVSIFAGKIEDVPEFHLRSRVEIRFSEDAFVQNFWANSRDFHERLRDRAAHRPDRQEERRRLMPEGMKAEKTHSVWANVDVLTRSGNQASLSFFTLPPEGLAFYHQYRDTSHLNIEPVLRVFTTTDELLFMMNESEPIVEILKPQMMAAEGI